MKIPIDYKLHDNYYLRENEIKYLPFLDPVMFILRNPNDFFKSSVFNNLDKYEILVSSLQNEFNTILKGMLNDELEGLNNINNQLVLINPLLIKRIKALISFFSENDFIKLKITISNITKDDYIPEIQIFEMLQSFYLDFSILDLNNYTKSINLPIGQVNNINYDDYRQSELSNSLIAIKEKIDEIKEYCELSTLHGSLATDDYIWRTSDVDIFIIFSKNIFESYETFNFIKQKIFELRRLFHKVDSLQHHGPIIIIESDLNFYPQSWWPLVLFDYCKLIFSKKEEILIKIRPSLIERRVNLIKAIYGLRHDAFFGEKYVDLYSLKYFFQVIQLTPIFYFQLSGSFLYKKHLFKLIDLELDENSKAIINLTSKFRNNNLYGEYFERIDPNKEINFEKYSNMLEIKRDLKQLKIEKEIEDSLPEDYFEQTYNFSEQMLKMVPEYFFSPTTKWEDELFHLPVLAEKYGDLWAKFMYSKIGNSQIDEIKYFEKKIKLIDFPQKIDISEYERIQNYYVEKLKLYNGILSIYKMGSISSPGLSDIDFLIIVDENNPVNFYELQTDFHKLSNDVKYVIKHPPSALLREVDFKNIAKLHPTFTIEHIYGKKIEVNLIDSEKNQYDFINIIDLLLMEFPIEFLEEISMGEVSVRNTLMRFKSLNLTLKILIANNVNISNDTFDFINKIKRLFENWFELSYYEQIKQIENIILKGVTIIYDIIETTSKLLEKKSFFYFQNEIEAVYAGKIYFINKWEKETAIYLSEKLLKEYDIAVSILPASFLINVLRYSKNQNSLSKRINSNFWFNKNQVAQSNYHIEKRNEALSNHYEFIELKKTNGGMFYPYHFCTDYMNPKENFSELIQSSNNDYNNNRFSEFMVAKINRIWKEYKLIKKNEVEVISNKKNNYLLNNYENENLLTLEIVSQKMIDNLTVDFFNKLKKENYIFKFGSLVLYNLRLMDNDLSISKFELNSDMQKIIERNILYIFQKLIQINEYQICYEILRTINLTKYLKTYFPLFNDINVIINENKEKSDIVLREIFINKEDSYTKKIESEIKFYENISKVHNLPESHHIYSKDIVAPALNQVTNFNNLNLWWVDEIEKLYKIKQSQISIYSLACGNADFEISLLNKLPKTVDYRFTAIELNPEMIKRGELLAKENNINNIKFLQQDINKIKINDTIDVLIVNQALHHFLELEHIFKEIKNSASADFIFLTNDMFGRNGHVMWDNTKLILDELWRLLPLKYKYNHYSKIIDNTMLNNDCSIDGFEGIRAQDILPLLIENFNVDIFVPFGAIFNRIVDRAYGHNFNINEKEDLNILNKISKIEQYLLYEKIISPVQAIIKLSKKENNKKCKYYYQSPMEVLNSRNKELEPQILANVISLFNKI